MSERPRILYLSMGGIIGRVPFQALLRGGHHIVGLLVPHPLADTVPVPAVSRPPPDPALALHPAHPPPTLHQQAAQGQVPLYSVGRLGRPEALSLLDLLAPDLICVACFPYLLPPAWLERPALGGLNLHPSLLPAYRGPHPLFWQFRAGEQQTGVSLHFMDEGADTGDLVAQTVVPFPDGLTGPEADLLTARAGADLLLEALRAPASIPRKPQPAAGASHQGRPGPADRVIPDRWKVRRAFNFIRGAGEWGPFWMQIGGQQIEGWQIYDALEYVSGKELGAPFLVDEEVVLVQFADGALRARTG